jgi:6-phospho-beta-glucosidase
MADLKLCVIGAGSTYTPELLEGILTRREELPIARVALMDIDREKLDTVAGLVRRMIEASGDGPELLVTTDRGEAIADSDFVVVQIRVGGIRARIQDEKIPLKFGVVGQETTGPGGFAKALRTIPVMLDIANDVSRLAPAAWLINFTNPSGLITEAIGRYSDTQVIGLCNSPIGLQRELGKHFGAGPSDVVLDYFGLNHLSWVRGVRVRGEDVTDRALEAAAAAENERDAALIRALRMIPSGYLRYYYFTDEVVEEQVRAPKTRGETVAEVETELLHMYRDPSLNRKPKELEKRGGAHYSEAAMALISAIHNDKNEWHVVNVVNAGCILDLPDQAVVEVPAQVNADGAHPLPVGALPLEVRGLVQAVKAYEELTVRAGAEGDRRAALLALTNHPLVPSFTVAQALLAELLEAHRNYLPQFFT